MTDDDEAHFVETPCRCRQPIEHCDMVRYIADVRIAFDEIERLTRQLEQMPMQVAA